MENKRTIIRKTLTVTVKGSESIPLDKLEPFQGNLKHIGKEQYENFRKNLIEFGISFVVHVWKNEGHNYIIDGHQRVFTLTQMKKIEGWVIPDVPVAVVEAENFAQAKRKVLAAASQYGTMTQESLSTYLKDNDIPFDEIVASFHFAEVNFLEMADEFNQQIEDNGIPDYEEPDSEKSTASGSSQVKQLQLFFTIDDYNEFVKKIEVLKTSLNLETITDTVMEVIREKYNSEEKSGA